MFVFVCVFNGRVLVGQRGQRPSTEHHTPYPTIHTALHCRANTIASDTYTSMSGGVGALTTAQSAHLIQKHMQQYPNKQWSDTERERERKKKVELESAPSYVSPPYSV